MKKTFFAIMAIALVTVAGACKKSAEGAEANKEEAKAEVAKEAENLTYTNEKCGYTVTLPAGYKPQNNLPEFEEMEATKLFTNSGSTIDFCVSKSDGSASDVEFAAAFYTVDEGETLIKKEVKDKEVIFQYKTADGSIVGHYNKFEKGKSVSINFVYPAAKEAEFNADFESVSKAFQFK